MDRKVGKDQIPFQGRDFINYSSRYKLYKLLPKSSGNSQRKISEK